jgi:hypothetical protein
MATIWEKISRGLNVFVEELRPLVPLNRRPDILLVSGCGYVLFSYIHNRVGLLFVFFFFSYLYNKAKRSSLRFSAIDSFSVGFVGRRGLILEKGELLLIRPHLERPLRADFGAGGPSLGGSPPVHQF